MIRNDIEEVWSSLRTPVAQNDITGKRAPDLPSDRSVYLGLDGTGRRHLLVQVPDETEAVVQRDTRGLQVGTARFRIGDNPEALYIDLVCIDASQNLTFSAVAQDLLVAMNQSNSPTDAVVGALNRWKAFWRVRPAGLSREEALGLFGELWFLRRWFGPVDAEKIERWMATPGTRHDFQWPVASVEVKTAATSAVDGPAHLISGLDQLDDPETGRLFLFSLQVVDDVLAGNTLAGLVDGLIEELRSSDAGLVLLNEKLAGYGYNPAEGDDYQRRLRIIGERLYLVDEGFPRLTRGSFQPAIPTGIGDISYTLRMSVCERWLVAKGPAEARGDFWK